MSAVPPALSTNPLVRIGQDVRGELRARGGFPAGDTRFDMRRTRQLATDPLPVLLDLYDRYGPVFSVRLLHVRQVFALGPEANHAITVAKAASFRWRDGGFGELQPLLGDGLLTIDGPPHRRARKVLLPGFHRQRIAAATDVMFEEIDSALGGLAPGQRIELFGWARDLAMRIAMRALLGLDPDGDGAGARAAREFERALSFYGTEFQWRILRGPGSPWKKMVTARDNLDAILYAEIARRRARNGSAPPEGEDLLDLLLAATDEDGRHLTDREVRDQAITLLFAGHDTTTSTIAFLFHELARAPREVELLLAEQAEVLGGREPTAADLAGAMPRLEMVLDEVLRLYPPAWIGPRRAVEDTELCGQPIPAGAAVNYSSWASHRLPGVWSDPEAFVPDRFAPEARSKLPKGAYVPFGGGSRTCIGMRFGEMEIRAIATKVLARFHLELRPGFVLDVRQQPTLGPRHGMPVTVRARG